MGSWGICGQALTHLSPSQIAAQELSDNRVITLSLAGRKLDKKVRWTEEWVSGMVVMDSVSAPGLEQDPTAPRSPQVCFPITQR